MKNSKWITAAAVLALSTSLAVASPNGTNGKRHGHHKRGGEFGARFAQKLNLTDAQKEQLRTINQQFREQNKTFFQHARDTRQQFRAAKQANDTTQLDALKATMEEQRAQFKSLRQAHREQILSILTPDQRQQLDALKAERQARRGEHGNRNRENKQ